MIENLPHRAIAISCLGIAALLALIMWLDTPSPPSPQSIVAPCKPQPAPVRTDTLAPGAYCFELPDDKALISFKVQNAAVDLYPSDMPLRVYLYDDSTQPRRTFDINSKQCTSLGLNNLSVTQYGFPVTPPPGYSAVAMRAGSRTFVKVRIRHPQDSHAFCKF